LAQVAQIRYNFTKLKEIVFFNLQNFVEFSVKIFPQTGWENYIAKEPGIS